MGGGNHPQIFRDVSNESLHHYISVFGGRTLVAASARRAPPGRPARYPASHPWPDLSQEFFFGRLEMNRRTFLAGTSGAVALATTLSAAPRPETGRGS